MYKNYYICGTFILLLSCCVNCLVELDYSDILNDTDTKCSKEKVSDYHEKPMMVNGTVREKVCILKGIDHLSKPKVIK